VFVPFRDAGGSEQSLCAGLQAAIAARDPAFGGVGN